MESRWGFLTLNLGIFVYAWRLSFGFVRISNTTEACTISIVLVLDSVELWNDMGHCLLTDLGT